MDLINVVVFFKSKLLARIRIQINIYLFLIKFNELTHNSWSASSSLAHFTERRATS